MASKNHIEFRVGVIVVLGLVILASSMYWLEGYKLERNSQLFRVHFSDVGSLAIGDKVTVSGVYRGKVNAFDLKDDGVLVEILVSRDVNLRRDASFSIKNMGVMGERFIAISPGVDSIPLDSMTIAQGQSDTGIPEIMGLLGETITELRNVISSFQQSVETESPLEKLNSTLTNLNSVTNTMVAYLERNETKLDSTAQNVYAASRQLNQLLGRNAETIDSTVTRLDRASIGVDRFVGQLDTIAVAVRTFTDALEAQDGTLQLLVEDRRLYDDLRQTADHIDDLIEDIKTNPRKYINLKFELF